MQLNGWAERSQAVMSFKRRSFFAEQNVRTTCEWVDDTGRGFGVTETQISRWDVCGKAHMNKGA